MKLISFFSIICLCFITFLELKSQNLCGYWAGYNYACYKINLDGSISPIYPEYELLYISQVADTLIATKVIGDDCVTSGFPSWKGQLFGSEKEIRATLFEGSPLQPNSSFRRIRITLVNNDSLKMYNPEPIFLNAVYPTYKRLTCEQAQKLGANLSDTRYNCDCDNSQPCKIDMPNAFTPNNDGLNDVFIPISICPFKTFEFKIFNRYGQIVFASNRSELGWDGRIIDIDAISDSYVWILNGLSQSGKVITLSGEVILLR